jgi:DNA-binding beta-propeller fold protein YncE
VKRLISSIVLVVGLLAGSSAADYTNFESSHVHPIALTPSGGRLLAVNTPDARLEVFDVEIDGSLTLVDSIPVGLEPVTVAARSDTEAWVVNNLSDTISVVDLAAGVVQRTLDVGDEPTDVVFTGSYAFVAVSQEDALKRYTLANLDAPPSVVPLFSRDIRALAVNGSRIYAVALRSGNRTSVVNSNIIFGFGSNLDAGRLAALNLSDISCAPPPYPPLPGGIARNPALVDPPASDDPAMFPPVSLIVGWDEASGEWRDEAGSNWNDCLPFRLPDEDLFIVDADTLNVTSVSGLGTLLFDVSVNPANGKVYVANTDARNLVRFEHSLGLQGHAVDNRLTIFDDGPPDSLAIVDLNAHVNRASNPATNSVERNASISQPGMLAWKADGSFGYLTGIGTRKLFRVDGTCAAAGCIFGPARATPVAVEVGEGPTGVALHEGRDRAYVLNRISHSITLVEASTMTRLDEIPLHDPSSAAIRDGRRFLYDAVDLSGHGDQACASCHPSGDMDGLAWDLGDPTGLMVPYTDPMDNVRFVVPQGGVPVECDSSVCASHDGFDPQKGPMATQTLRGMLEPLHWRGDRATMNEFNPAFVGLLGAADVGPVNGKPAGVSAADMEKFRQFALGIAYPPNPYRNVDDTTPCGPRSTDPACEVAVHGQATAGNPTEGALMFDTQATDAGQPCQACHAHPFGAATGKLGGVTPTEPTSPDAAALFFGDADQSRHNDLKIPHLRNMYDKFGPVLASPGGMPPDAKTGFGFAHDGAMPDLERFFSINVFALSDANQAQEVRDIASFMFHFPTSTKPSVGRQATVPAGAPPTGTAGEEALISTLTSLGDLTDGNRQCELVASTVSGGRTRSYHLSAGFWVPDVAVEAALTTTDLRQNAASAITFTCTPLGSGPRLGGNRDEDAALDGDDCAPADPGAHVASVPVTGVVVEPSPTTNLSWVDQGTVYDVLGGSLAALRGTGVAATSCVEADVAGASYADVRPDPAPGDGYYYLVRALNACGAATLGAGRESVDPLDCVNP